MEKIRGQLILEDGTRLFGTRFGSVEDGISELVFNTSPVGYQELVSDPSYTDQTVVMAYPLIGNYGIADDDYETYTPTIGGLVVRDYCDTPSNFRSVMTLSELLKKYGIPGISGVDTRRLVRIIRDGGCQKALITGEDTTLEEGLARLKEYTLPKDAVSRVSTKEPRVYPAENERFKIVLIDCGAKLNIIRSMNALGCTVTALPWDTKPEDVDAMRPDGILLSNGPGDPEDVVPVIELVKELRGKYPILGVCLGHQMISLAYGAKTYKLKFGHRGGNHPVRELKTGKIEITSQNHSYAVDAESVKGTGLTVTHVNLLDDTVEGVECREDMLMSVQYHPESAPGPDDSRYIFGRFIDMMEEFKNGEKD